MCVSGVYALTSSGNTAGIFSTGAVDLEAEVYTVDDNGQEVVYDDSRVVFPGDEVPLIAKVYNVGASSYVRAKIEITQGESLSGVDFENSILGITSDWEKIGDYYYHIDEVDSGDVLQLFSGVKVPEGITNANGGDQFKVIVVAEAVQSKNFEPDYSLADPWKGITIEKSSVSEATLTEEAKITLKFENIKSGDIDVPDDLIYGLSKLLPGDSLTEYVKITNTSSSVNEYLLSIIGEGDSSLEKDLLKYVNVKITNKAGKVLYEGSMAGIKNLSLGKFASGESDNLKFEISIPFDLENKYAGLNPKLTWDFSVKSPNNPNTGDFGINMAITIFFISSLGLVIVLALARKERNKAYSNR